MYFAGLRANQVLEALVVLTNLDFLRHIFIKTRAVSSDALSKAGRVRADSMPTLLSQLISPIHLIAIIISPIIYVVSLFRHGLDQPHWMGQYALPDVDQTWKTTLRVFACLSSLVLRKLVDRAFYHLGDQWHVIGRRERPRVVQTGPYAWVRHPMYTTGLVLEVLWCIMFWSYAPILPLAITAAAFAIKIPIEEEAIQRDDGIREEYKEYMKKVPAKVLPYIW